MKLNITIDSENREEVRETITMLNALLGIFPEAPRSWCIRSFEGDCLKIKMIKNYRDYFSTDLKSAKHAIDNPGIWHEIPRDWSASHWEEFKQIMESYGAVIVTRISNPNN